MASWLSNPLNVILSYQSNTGLQPDIPVSQQTSTGVIPPTPEIGTDKQVDDQSLIDVGSFLGLILILAIAAVWCFFHKRQ